MGKTDKIRMHIPAETNAAIKTFKLCLNEHADAMNKLQRTINLQTRIFKEISIIYEKTRIQSEAFESAIKFAAAATDIKMPPAFVSFDFKTEAFDRIKNAISFSDVSAFVSLNANRKSSRLKDKIELIREEINGLRVALKENFQVSLLLEINQLIHSLNDLLRCFYRRERKYAMRYYSGLQAAMLCSILQRIKITFVKIFAIHLKVLPPFSGCDEEESFYTNNLYKILHSSINLNLNGKRPIFAGVN